MRSNLSEKHRIHRTPNMKSPKGFVWCKPVTSSQKLPVYHACQDRSNLHPEFLLLPEEESFNLLQLEILTVGCVSSFLKWVKFCKFSVTHLSWPTRINYYILIIQISPKLTLTLLEYCFNFFQSSEAGEICNAVLSPFPFCRNSDHNY